MNDTIMRFLDILSVICFIVLIGAVLCMALIFIGVVLYRLIEIVRKKMDEPEEFDDERDYLL